MDQAGATKSDVQARILSFALWHHFYCIPGAGCVSGNVLRALTFIMSIPNLFLIYVRFHITYFFFFFFFYSLIMLLKPSWTNASYYSSIISVALIPVVFSVFILYHCLWRKRLLQYHRLSFRVAIGIGLSGICHSICQILLGHPGLMQRQTELQLRVLVWFNISSNVAIVLFMSFLMVYMFLTVVTQNEKAGYKFKDCWGPEIAVLTMSLLVSHPILYIYDKVEYQRYIQVNGNLPWYQKDWWGLEFAWILVGLVASLAISGLLWMKARYPNKYKDRFATMESNEEKKQMRIPGRLLATCLVMSLSQVWPLVCNLQGGSQGLYGFAMLTTNLSGLLTLSCLLITIEPFRRPQDQETEIDLEEKPLDTFAPQASDASTIHLSPYQSRQP